MLMDNKWNNKSQFRYLGSLILADEYCTKDIQSRIEMMKKVFLKKKK